MILPSAIAFISVALMKLHLNDHTSPCVTPNGEGWEKELAEELPSLSLSLSRHLKLPSEKAFLMLPPTPLPLLLCQLAMPPPSISNEVEF